MPTAAPPAVVDFLGSRARLLDGGLVEMSDIPAGHMPPLLRTGDGEVIEIGGEEAGLPLGVIDDYQYEAYRREFLAGSSALFASAQLPQPIASLSSMRSQARPITADERRATRCVRLWTRRAHRRAVIAAGAARRANHLPR